MTDILHKHVETPLPFPLPQCLENQETFRDIIEGNQENISEIH